jgi:NAD(P)-dependent dehydrogenase (short-subunit alcohol dehydrogenase family)
MGMERKVAVITGGSKGIGAVLVKACPDRNYRIAATACSIRPSRGSDILVVPGDIGDRKTGTRAIFEGVTRAVVPRVVVASPRQVRCRIRS